MNGNLFYFDPSVKRLIRCLLVTQKLLQDLLPEKRPIAGGHSQVAGVQHRVGWARGRSLQVLTNDKAELPGSIP